jgi:DNA-binding NtrC family response regulator
LAKTCLGQHVGENGQIPALDFGKGALTNGEPDRTNAELTLPHAGGSFAPDRKSQDIESALAHCKSIVSWQEKWMEKNVSMKDYRSETGFQEIVGDTPALRQALQLTMRVARRDVPVLILGEAGSGKESFARAIHRISARRNESFVKANCTVNAEDQLKAQLFGRDKGPETKSENIGLLDTAHHGILFLDEIGHVSLDLQARLLRLMERGEFERPGSLSRIPVSVRLIAATTYDLAERVAAQMFLSDLYDRLNVLPYRFLRCAIGAPTFLCWRAISCRGSPAAPINTSKVFRPRP